jgi:hypothetical protein
MRMWCGLCFRDTRLEVKKFMENLIYCYLS